MTKSFKIYKAIIMLTILSLTLGFVVKPSDYTSESYVMEKGEMIPIPEAYTFKTSISKLSDGSTLKSPSDIAVEEDGIYVADTGNNRIVKLSHSGKLLQEYLVEDNGGLNFPEGIFVHKGDLFIADTENKRIVRLNNEGEFIEEFVKPTSNLLDDEMIFAPSKIAVSNNNVIYVLSKTKFQGFFTIDMKNQFMGYVGANKLGYSFKDVVVRMFGSEKQKKLISRRMPAAATSFSMFEDDIFSVTNEQFSSSISRINSIGLDLYPKRPASVAHVGNFSDVVASNGIISAIDSENCTINQFDFEGNILAVFGSKGVKKGSFDLPVAIESDSSANLYVVDSAKNNIQIFTPSEFVLAVHEACRLFNDGLYEASKDKWETVLYLNEGYSLAYRGIGEALYCEGEFEEAMTYFEYAGDKNGYSKSFDEERHNIFRQRFTVLVIVFLAVLFFVIFLLTRLKRYSDKKF